MRQQFRFKRTILCALIIGLALGARAAANVAEVTVGDTTMQYDDLGVAWTACKNQIATLKLLKDVDITSVLNKDWDATRSLHLRATEPVSVQD